ncbi:DNA polymerase III subunit chi [Aestuariibacter halophilus]|uniref:DNA polymerase III subunit chi n=1 Tax=Fluctibacter halophilus TaxID=226011 RepID=A0ABS8G9Y1_9ALTE|nr:DNA polymerase III subunit chi [Aestuariibacter halophilus]MCC2617318.1 DNA polymerase III subunit chi [Aestuariibacter halophilus]
MPNITFYLHDQGEPSDVPAHWLTACHVAAELSSKRQWCLVLCESQQQAEAVDELLWQFPAERFVAHNLSGEGPAKGAPVEIAWQAPARPNRHTLINLSGQIPADVERYRQLIDFVPADEAAKQSARERYKAFRAAGYSLETQPASSITEKQHG